MDATANTSTTKPVIKSRFISHGTLPSRDLDATRKFYEEFLGLEVVRTSKISMMVRLGGEHVYAVVKTTAKPTMDRLHHNGLDVDNDDEVKAAHKACVAQAELWGLKDIAEPQYQHGTFSFMFRDMDDNLWEILSNPKGGYTWIFDQGDQEGKGHWAKDFRDKLPQAAN